MNNTRNVACPVDTEGAYGEYANAFRVMQDGPDVLLDFCVYSESDHKARLVSRVRVPPTFLKVILSRLTEALDVPEPERGKLYVMPEIKGLN